MGFVIDNCPKLKISTLVKNNVFKYMDNISILIMSFDYYGSNVTLEVAVTPREYECEIKSTYEGETHTQTFHLRDKPTNLNKSVQWFFVCPFTHRSIRNLYFTIIHDPTTNKSVGGFITRTAIRNAVYAQQMESKRDRMFRQYHHYQNAYRKWGKVHYRGYLTPYGKRMYKAEWYDNLVCENIFTFVAKKLPKG